MHKMEYLYVRHSQSMDFLKRHIGALILWLLPKKVKKLVIDNANLNIYYSQEGEDILIDTLLKNKSNGFYVDVGAHHPIRFSNTYKFYREGWSGINIDPMPGSMLNFNRLRPRDRNLELAVSSNQEHLIYHMFDEPAINTFSESEAKRKLDVTHYKLVDTKVIETTPLEKILDDNLPPSQDIDFFTIDVEGLDLEVLKSNNWTKYRPKFVLVESLTSSLILIEEDKTYLFMGSIGYELIAKTKRTYFFSDAHK